MDKTAATALATRLHEQLGGKVLRVRAEHVNPQSGHGDIGWAARVVREDGSAVDVIGSDASGYQRTDSALGWVTLDRIVGTLLTDLPDSEPDAAATSSLVERVTALAAGLAEMGRELAAVRDELVLRGVK